MNVNKDWSMQVESSSKLEDQEAGELVNGIDPLWVLIERVVAKQENKSKLTVNQ